MKNGQVGRRACGAVYKKLTSAKRWPAGAGFMQLIDFAEKNS
jgi:hypothetical protein